MDSKIFANFHRFGKAGKMIMTILMVIGAFVTIVCLAATIYIAMLPKDALTVQVTDHAEFRINEKNFTSFWNFTCCFCNRSFVYAEKTVCCTCEM